MLIKKVSFIKDKVQVTYREPDKQQTSDVKSKQPPLKDFIDALQNMEFALTDLPFSDSVSHFEIKSLHIKYDDDDYPDRIVVGASVYQKGEEEAELAFNFNTQLISLTENEELAGLVDDIIAQAKAYLRGERAQGDLFSEEKPETQEDRNERILDEEEKEPAPMGLAANS